MDNKPDEGFALNIAKSIRELDEKFTQEFRGFRIVSPAGWSDELSVAEVPAAWGNEDRAESYLRDNFSMSLPRLFVSSEGFRPADKESSGIPTEWDYRVIALTRHQEDMNQIVEQVLTKFVPNHPLQREIKGDGWKAQISFESAHKGRFTVPSYHFLFTVRATFYGQFKLLRPE